MFIKKTFNKKIFSQIVFSVLLSSLLVCGFVFAWTAPLSNPPSDNVDAPINVGSTAQTKEGDLNIGGGLKYWITKDGDSFALKNDTGEIKFVLTQNGDIGVGTTSPSAKLEVNGKTKIEGELDISGYKITNLAEPENPSDAATKNYVDTRLGGGGASCVWRYVSSDNHTLTCNPGEFMAGIHYEGAEWKNQLDWHTYPEIDAIYCCQF